MGSQNFPPAKFNLLPPTYFRVCCGSSYCSGIYVNYQWAVLLASLHMHDSFRCFLMQVHTVTRRSRAWKLVEPAFLVQVIVGTLHTTLIPRSPRFLSVAKLSIVVNRRCHASDSWRWLADIHSAAFTTAGASCCKRASTCILLQPEGHSLVRFKLVRAVPFCCTS